MPLDRVLDRYAAADVLVLASETEGWPKVIAEAMASGVLCIGSDRGLIPWMLGERRGLLVPPGDAAALAQTLAAVARQPESRYACIGPRAALWAQQHSLDSFRDALAGVLRAWWGDAFAGAPVDSDDVTATVVRQAS